MWHLIINVSTPLILAATVLNVLMYDWPLRIYVGQHAKPAAYNTHAAYRFYVILVQHTHTLKHTSHACSIALRVPCKHIKYTSCAGFYLPQALFSVCTDNACERAHVVRYLLNRIKCLYDCVPQKRERGCITHKQTNTTDKSTLCVLACV